MASFTITAPSKTDLSKAYPCTSLSNGVGDWTGSDGPYDMHAFYLGGSGWDGQGRIWVQGYEFTTPASGVVQFSFTLTAKTWSTDYTSHTQSKAAENLGFVVYESDTDIPNPNTKSLGTITVSNKIFQSNVVNLVLAPKTKHYLWIFSKSYYQGYWDVGSVDITVTYTGGVVKICASDGWKNAIPYIYNGEEWKMAIPYVYVNSTDKWKICGV